MKRINLFVAFLLIITILSPLTLAQDEINTSDVPFLGGIQEGQETYIKFQTADNQTEYLKQEWINLAEKNEVMGPIIRFLDPIFRFLSPLFKIILGVDSALSWVFVFAVMIWLMLIFFLNPVFSELLKNPWTGLASAIITASLIGLTGAIRYLVNGLTTIIESPWIAAIAFVVAIILVLLSEKFGKITKEKIKKGKEESMRKQREIGTKRIKAHGEVSKGFLESLSKRD